MTLQGKRIAITGAFGVVGAALVDAVARAGAQVAAIDRLPDRGSTRSAVAIGEVDVSEPAAAEAAMSRAAEKLGGIDGLINVAGTFRWETIESGSVDTWDLLYRVNLRSAVVASRAALPHLLKSRGRIVNLGAMAAQRAANGMGAYTASKAGVARLTEALAEELKDRGVTVNAVLPSIIDTPQNRADMPDADFDRWVRPDALAAVICFLLSDASAAVTGALIPVTGRV